MLGSGGWARRVSEPYSAQMRAGHVVGMQRAAAEGADPEAGGAGLSLPIQSSRRPLEAEPKSKSALGLPAASGLARVAAAQVGRTAYGRARPRRHRIHAQVCDQVLIGINRGGNRSCFSRAARRSVVAFGRHEEVEDVGTVLDGAEVGAVPPALADVEGRLAKAALLGSSWRRSGEVIDPALLRARADVEIYLLDGFERADRVLAALGGWMPSRCEGAPSILPLSRRLAPALGLVADLAGAGLAPLDHLLIVEGRALRGVDQGVDGAGVVDLVGGDRRGVGSAGRRGRTSAIRGCSRACRRP